VKFSAVDAIELGFEVTVISDGCRGIDVRPGDVENALQQILGKGATLTLSRRLLQDLKVDSG
jgi:nicotinamidase/pyrazinamidase